MTDESLGHARLHGQRPAVITSGVVAARLRSVDWRGSVVVGQVGPYVFGAITAGLAERLAEQLARAQPIIADDSLSVDEAIEVAKEKEPAAAELLQAIRDDIEAQTLQQRRRPLR
jgi:hypothetical protein